MFNRNRLTIELRRDALGAGCDRRIDLRSRQMRHDQIADTQSLADAQIALDTVAEQGMDDAATVADCD